MNEDRIWGSATKSVGKDGKSRKSTGLAKLLCQAAEESLGVKSGEIRLLVTVIISGAKNRDIKFLYSDKFSYYCTLLGLTPSRIRWTLLKFIKFIDDGVGDINLGALDNDEL
jgi:hypothetical protein